MDKELYLCSLYEYYECLLTEKQREYFEDYYFDNLTIMEIAENNNISKNAISKSLIDVKEKLYEYESALKLYENKEKIKSIVSEEVFDLINDYI